MTLSKGMGNVVQVVVKALEPAVEAEMNRLLKRLTSAIVRYFGRQRRHNVINVIPTCHLGHVRRNHQQQQRHQKVHLFPQHAVRRARCINKLCKVLSFHTTEHVRHFVCKHERGSLATNSQLDKAHAWTSVSETHTQQQTAIIKLLAYLVVLEVTKKVAKVDVEVPAR